MTRLVKSRPAEGRRMPRRPHSWLYRAYIDRNSWLWRVRRFWWLRSTGWQCERCGARENLTIHHLTYARLGRERRGDVEVLCWRCHASGDGWRHASATPARRGLL